MQRRIVDVQEVFDAHPLSKYQKIVIVLCFLVAALDGFDTAAVGFIAPMLKTEWGVSPVELAPLFAAGLFGLMTGAFIFGPLSDRIGRKPVLLVTTVFFGLATCASTFATDIEMLTAMRFITGLGLGGAMPASVTVTAEISPQARRATLVTMMFCGFTIGSAAAGLAASHIMAVWGWQGLLALGGVLPLLHFLLLWALLPESPRYLARHGAAPDRIAALLKRLVPAANLEQTEFAVPVRAPGSPVRQLFGRGLAMGTILIWVTFFMSLLVFYLLSSWLPLLITSAGFSMGSASAMGAMLAMGGTIGAIVIGRMMDAFEPHKVLAGAYIVASLFVVILGHAVTVPWLLVVAIFGAGFGVAGAQVGINALAAGYYPTESRGTGVSWAHAVGRTGSILGSVTGGVLLSLGWDLSTVFAVAALSALVAALAMLAKAPRSTRTAVQSSPSRAE
ncbi:MFS transporter [Rhizobium sp. P32RR-XVIII]|uniref:MFS transporter n=1 Tax=Rhizobium sp. P32RR-XVIII TaxID=2726738 RepID=UPI0014568B5A|nr:MFS transporter [Rhizobium sp. P32RR-XVIII]NLS05984.1 MFS transporter [Rhizobium sp. P32RR-XVIII]